MKNLVLTYLLLFPFFGSNIQQSIISEIDEYIKLVESNKDLSVSITEYIIENNKNKIIGGEDIYSLNDSNQKSIRLWVEHVSESQFEYYFYYKENELVYAQYAEYGDKELHTLELDTLSFVKYYFQNEQLIKGIALKGELNTEKNIINKSNYYLKKVD